MVVKRLKLNIRKCINLPSRNNISYLIESCFNVIAWLPVTIWTFCAKCILNWHLLKFNSHITSILDDESFWNLAQSTTIWYPWRHHRLYEIIACVAYSLIPELQQLYLCAFPFRIRWLFQCLSACHLIWRNHCAIPKITGYFCPNWLGTNILNGFIPNVKSYSQVYISNVLKVSSIRALWEISEGFGSYEISYEQFCERSVQTHFSIVVYFSVPIPCDHSIDLWWPYFPVPLPRPTWCTDVSLCHFRW